MAALFPVLTGRERHIRKGSVPEHSIFRLKSYVNQTVHSVSPSPDLNYSTSKSQTFRHRVAGRVDAAVQTSNIVRVQTKRAAPREDLDRLEAELDQLEMQAIADGGLGVKAYLAHLEEVKRRVKRWDEQLGGMLGRIVAGLHKGLETYPQSIDFPVLSPHPAEVLSRHDFSTQTDIPRNTSPERYPGLFEAQEALERLRDVKYSGVATKLSELYRALSRLASADFPDPPSDMQDIATLPDAFAQELKQTFRLLHKDIAQAVLLKHKRPASVSVALQTDGSGPDPLKVFELEQGIREREAALSRLQGDLAELRVSSKGNEENLTQFKNHNLNLEEKCVRLDMEVKALRTKEQTASTALQEARQQHKASEEKRTQVQQAYMHLLSTLYTASDKVRRAEREALHLEETVAIAQVTHEIDLRRLRGENTEQLDEELRVQRGKTKGEYEAKKAEMIRRHQLMEQQLQDQSFKVDALLESGNALLRPKPRVWTEEAEEPQSPMKSPKKPRAVPLDDTEEDTPKVKVQRQRQETDSEDEDDPPSPVRSPIRSFRPVPSPTREAGSRTEPRSPTLQSFPAPQTTKEKPSPIGLKVQRVVSGSSPLSSSLPVEGVSQLVAAGKQQETERSATEALTAMSAESVAEERALLEQLSPNEQAVFYKAKALLEHQRVWELAVRTGMCSKATQTGEQGLPLPAIQAIDDEDIETEGTPWLKQLAPSPQGLSPRSKRRYHQAVLKAFVGHSERCGAVCQHLLRAMQVRRKVRGLLLPLRVVNVRYRLAK